MAGKVTRLIIVLVVFCPPCLSLFAQDEPYSAEIGSHAGVIDGEYAAGGSFLFNLTNCMGIQASLDAVIDDDGYSDLIASGNLVYGLWYCCIPAYYVRFVYLTTGVGTFSRMGKGDRLQYASFNLGIGARISLNEKLGLRGEIKDFVLFREFDCSHILACRLGLDFLM